ncbi:MAG: acetolactate synthase [Elusimicrobiota bacterium]
MSVKIVSQYTVFLPNVPGALSRFIELFVNEGINIIGIASEIRDDSGVVRVTVDTEKKISYILTSAGFTTVETPMISIELTDKPGELLNLAKLLAGNSINITTVYGTALGGNTARILINVSDADRAVEILKAGLDDK